MVTLFLVAVPVTDTATGNPQSYEPTEVIEETVQETDSEYIEEVSDGTQEEYVENDTPIYKQPEAVSKPTQEEVKETEPVPAEEAHFDEEGYLKYVSYREIEMLAYLVDMEAGYAPSDGGSLPDYERAAVVWCVLNRVDKGSRGGFRDSVYGVLTQSGQFRTYYGTGSRANTDLVVDTLTLWCMEKQSGYPIAQRSLPRSYCWYYGNGSHNFFRDNYKSPYTVWDWSWS